MNEQRTLLFLCLRSKVGAMTLSQTTLYIAACSKNSKHNDASVNTKGGGITVPSFDWFGISCMTTDNFGFYLQNRLIQTSQTGGQWYSDTSPISIPWMHRITTLSTTTHIYTHLV